MSNRTKLTTKLAAQLEIPHHEGAGGVDDFVDKETFLKHVRKVNNRSKRKRYKGNNRKYNFNSNQN